MNLFFYITIIVGFSLIYYGYVKKIDNDLKEKELEFEEKKIELEIKKLDHHNGELEKEEH
ncbi:hypothetical protein SAMN05216353_10213 [Halobacillus alkaliphilus]|uniref:Uncharacterized protein n=1 Tax=Halobacillus alkaliphilus TaxID=396056 RepID=A0A1I2JSF7_9BACI|nr:hypothetical protein [Halobacillus alkaliphilus]SFF56913.1 hypothetical protein SAMN05216353_10213 [Halobacillus alkaliphilus]